MDAFGFHWNDATEIFLGMIFLAVVAWFIRHKYRQKRADEAVKQETVMLEEIGRKAAKIAEEKIFKQTAIQMSCFGQMFNPQVLPLIQ